jgi:hypothetical protein
MIAPSYSLTATERVLPKLALDFTTASLDPRVTFTRTGNTATVTNSTGVIVGINADLPRFDFDPVTLVCRGLLIEESRTNVLLNSLLDGTSLATQTVVVTAAATTLSFYGTGQIVLSGAASATVTGTGAYPTRTVYTFTPSAGSLTLTVTGTVQFAQLELGSFATSFIPTAASQVTRTADVATMTGTNFSDWFNATEGAFNIQFIFNGAGASLGTNRNIFAVSDGSANNAFAFYTQIANSRFRLDGYDNGATQFGLTYTAAGAPSAGTLYDLCLAYKLNSFAGAINGNTVSADASGTVPPNQNNLVFGASGLGTLPLNGVIQKFSYYPQRLINNEVQAFSK